MKADTLPVPKVWFLASFLFTSCVNATAVSEEVTIDFEADVLDTMTRRFTSVDSPLATFTSRTTLWIRRGLPEFLGTGIESFGTGITIEFAKPVVSLSILFGNDDSGFPEARALLRAFNAEEFVGRQTLLFNRNDLPDQTITIATPVPFNKAIFQYVDSSLTQVSGLGEVISEVRFTVVPEPSSLALGSVFLACVAANGHRRVGRRSRPDAAPSPR